MKYYPGCPLRTEDEIAALAFDLYKSELARGESRVDARRAASILAAELCEENRRHAAGIEE